MKTYVLQALLLTLAVAVVRAANTGVFHMSIEQNINAYILLKMPLRPLYLRPLR